MDDAPDMSIVIPLRLAEYVAEVHSSTTTPSSVLLRSYLGTRRLTETRPPRRTMRSLR
jgi:hypothetical protein